MSDDRGHRQRHPGGRPRRRCWSSTVVQRRRAARPSPTSRRPAGWPSRRPRGCSTALERTGLLERDDDRLATSPAGSSGCTPRGTTRGRSWSGWPARRMERDRRATPARPSTSASPAATASCRSPRSTPATCSAPATGPRSTCPPTAPRSARCSRLRRAALPDRPAGAADRRPRSPTPTTLRARRRRATRRRGWAVTVDELEVGLTGVAVPVRGPRRRRGRRPRRLGPHPTARGPARRARPQL